ncbi:MAG: hypothetical protein KDB14_24845 [Planctomycetales bacterium]|nr:hypothetical protein [Planctomycetales bacterium]
MGGSAASSTAPFRSLGSYILLAMSCSVLVWSIPGGAFPEVAAQAPPAPAPPANPGAESPPPIQELKMGDIYLEQDKVVLPGVPLEEWDRMRRQANMKLPPPPPSYSLERVEMTGAVTGVSGAKADDPLDLDLAVAELKVQLRIRITDSSRTVRVPIQLGDVILRTAAGKPTYEGDGSARLEYVGGEKQYYCVVSGEPDSEHLVGFDIACAVKPDRLGQRLAIAMPSGPAKLSLTVPRAPLEASISQGAFLLTSKPGKDETELHLEGQGGDMQLTWRRGAARAPQPGPSLTAQTTIEVQVQSELDVQIRATLLVSQVGAPLTSFDVQLPPNMALVPGQRQPGIGIGTLPGAETASARETVRVTLDKPSDEPVRVELQAALTRGGTPGKFQAIGFEVLDAVQRGSVVVTSAKGWTAQPVNPVGVSRVSPPPDSPTGAWQYAFENRPRSLTVQVSPAKSRLHIQPTYLVHIVRGQLNLRASLKCRWDGSNVGSLSLRLPGWTVRDVRSNELEELSTIDLTSVDPLEIPVLPQDEDARAFTVLVDAAMPLSDDASDLEFEFPTVLTPPNTTVTASAAQMLVTMADDIVVSPDAERMRGLTPIYGEAPESLTLPVTQRPPLMYNDLVGEASPRFAGTVSYHEQALSADVLTQLTIGASFITVKQTFAHQVSYVPAAHIMVDAPAELLEPEAQLSVTQDDVPLNFGPVDLPARPGRAALRIELPRRTIGDCRLSFSYRWRLPPGDERQVSLPLAIPLLPEGVAEHRLELHVGEELGLEATLGAGWRFNPVVDNSESVSDAAENGTVENGTVENGVYLAEDVGDRVPIHLRAQTMALSDGVLVTRTWLQSWLQEDRRLDRAAFRLRSDRPLVAIELPSELANIPSLRAAVDGHSVTYREITNRRISVPVATDGDEHVLELWYTLQGEWLGAPAMSAPHVVDSVELGRAYWELLAPESHQLISGPANLTPDMVWRWRNGIPQQLASQTSERLERWIGASQQPPLPVSLKGYLFTTSGALPAVSLRLAPFHWLIIAVAGLVMTIVWCCLQWPALRSPGALVWWGLALLGVGVTFPALAWGMAQAVALGAALIAVGQLLQQSLSPPAPQRTNHTELSTRTIAFPRRQEGSQSVTFRGDGSSHGSATASSLPLVEPKS